MDSRFEVITEYKIMPGAVLYSTSLGGVLIGCPPEVLKTLLSQHLPMPNQVVIPETLIRGNSSQACLEFPFYHFLFIQQGLAQGKKFRVFGSPETLDRLQQTLRVTLLGPTLEEAMACEERMGLVSALDAEKVQAWVKESAALALKGKDGHVLQVEELVEFIPFDVGEEVEVFGAVEDQPAVMLKRLGPDQYVCHAEAHSFDCDLSTTEAQTPAYEVNHTPVSKKETTSDEALSIRVLGVSEGFDPMRPANGLLLRLRGKWLLWDCPSYAHVHLEKMGLSLADLEGIVVSHVHEDHLEVAETLQPGKKTKIYSSPEIFESLLVKLMALLGCDHQTAASHYEFVPLYVDQPFDLFGATAEVFYSVHVIPALGLRLEVPSAGGQTKRIFISGDQLSGPAVENLVKNGTIDEARQANVNGRFKEDAYDAFIVDVGGGMIHGEPSDFFDRTDGVMYMHTGKHLSDLPQGHRLLCAGDFIELFPG